MIELATILVLGIFAQWFAWKVKLPAILPLIILGLAVGPLSTFFTPDGTKLVDGDGIFSGELLFSFVALSVGVILFEGSLSLKIAEIKKLATTVRNLLTLGVLITLTGATLTAYYLLGLDFKIAFLFGALIIVTGPTVVLPILRNVRPNQNINTILKWEGILIDPLGALIAVLVFEFIRTSNPGTEYTFVALKGFIATISIGSFLGAVAALLLYYILRKNRIAHYLRNVVALALVVLTFAIAEFLMHESGLLAATVMGLILTNLKFEGLKNLLSFKEEISIILVSVLFIILSSRIDMDQINKLGIESLLLFGVVTLLIRPLSVFLCSFKSGLTFKEKLFISWIGPRGIVAAAVTSLFSLELLNNSENLTPKELADTSMLLPLVFLIIVGTVVIQGSTAKVMAKWLGVERKEPQGVLFVGANEASRAIAYYFQEKLQIPVLMADISQVSTSEAKAMNLPVFEGDILRDNVMEDLDLSYIGKLFALTPNSEINNLACAKYASELGEDHVYRMVTKREMELTEVGKPKNLLFHGYADYITLLQTIRNKPEFKQETVNSSAELEDFLKKSKNIIPIFLCKTNGVFRTISGFDIDVSNGDRLLYVNNKVVKDL